MIKQIKKIVWKFLNWIRIGGGIQLMLNSQLLEDGWFRSFRTKKSVNKQGNPLPWYTYSFIKFIGPRLKENFDVFEFGAGNSTIWYAKKVNMVVSVEHDYKWYQVILNNIPANVKLIFCELVCGGDYCKTAVKQDKKFHVIVIDGRDRVNCINNILDALTDDGVVIFDNSHIEEYHEGVNYLENNGFKHIDFKGILPVVAGENQTSIFYRRNNCIGI